MSNIFQFTTSEGMLNRVVVTGIGAVTPLGCGMDETFRNLIKGKSGVSKISSFDASGHASQIAAEIRELPVLNYFSVKELRKHDRFSQFAWIAAQEAMEHSGLLNSGFDGNRAGIYLGSGIGGVLTQESTSCSYNERGPRGVSPFYISNLIGNMGGGNIAIRYGFRGTNFSIVSACATGTHCIGEGYREIGMGRHDIMLVGGAEAAITPLTIAGFSNMKAMSRCNDYPELASRPYDRNRDGFVMGEGAGILVLESLDHAKSRSADILAEVIGYGATCDAHHITAVAPQGEGIARATRIALQDAQINPEDVQVINSHGTSTPVGDREEMSFILSVFGDHAPNLWISSSKSMIGHLLGAAGGVESAICVKSIVDGVVHPTLNFESTDDGINLDFMGGPAREKSIDVILKNSMGFGGHNAALLFRKFNG